MKLERITCPRCKGSGQNPAYLQRGQPAYCPRCDTEGTVPRPLPRVRLTEIYPWDNQAPQYPAEGDPGITYLRGNLPSGEGHVDCLLLYDVSGKLAGILNHYPMDFPPFDRKGNYNIWIRPDARRQGLGRELLTEALRRWDDIDLYRQDYTPAGRQLARGIIERMEREEVLNR